MKENELPTVPEFYPDKLKWIEKEIIWADNLLAELNTVKEPAKEDKRTKYTRYKQRMVADGRCPHCGRPCLPYYECAERRSKKNRARSLRSKFNRSSKPDDVRKQPRKKR
jgi:hypothetical protein